MARASIKLDSYSRKLRAIEEDWPCGGWDIDWGERVFEIVFTNIERETKKSDAMVDVFLSELSQYGEGCRCGGDELGEIISYIVDALDVEEFKAAYRVAKKKATAAGRAAV